MSSFFYEALPYATNIIVAILAFFFGRKKSKADIERVEIESLRMVIESHQKSIEFLQSQVNTLRTELEKCKRHQNN